MSAQRTGTLLAAGLLATALVQPAQAQSSRQPAKPEPQTATAPAPSAPDGDSAYGAYQRGHYLTAFAEATKRVEERARAAA